MEGFSCSKCDFLALTAHELEEHRIQTGHQTVFGVKTGFVSDGNRERGMISRERGLIVRVLLRVLQLAAAVVGVALVGLGASMVWFIATCDGWECLAAQGAVVVAAVSFIVAVPFLFATVAVARWGWTELRAHNWRHYGRTRTIIDVLVLALVGGLVVVVYTSLTSGTESFPTEAALRERAEAASEAASSASLRDHPFDAYEDVYRFMTPEFRKKCRSDTFAGEAFDNLLFMGVQHGRPYPDFSELSFQVTNVTVNGTEGLVELKVSYKGDRARLGGDQEPDQWVFDEGKWWIKSSRYWMSEIERERGGCKFGGLPFAP